LTGIVIAYLLAWAGHFFIERKPAMRVHPSAVVVREQHAHAALLESPAISTSSFGASAFRPSSVRWRSLNGKARNKRTRQDEDREIGDERRLLWNQPILAMPALGRASTIHGRVADKIVDGRDKPGHDDVWLDKLAATFVPPA
jgi:hypothetical protein